MCFYFHGVLTVWFVAVVEFYYYRRIVVIKNLTVVNGIAFLG